MANIFNINDQSILATASITITDQTDASTLAGGISVVSGSKNQVYLNGTSAPFSPNWEHNNLVLRPYLYASNIERTKGLENKYNPDLFDPEEYPDLNNPGDGNVSVSYINTSVLTWYYRDGSGVEIFIDPATDPYENFDFIYTHNNKMFSDKRFLVIKKNFVPKDTFITIICKFSFYDPFAKMYIQQQYEIDLSCLSTGLGANQLLIHPVNGNTIHNSYPTYIDLHTSFFKNGVELDIQKEIESADKASTLQWFIRSAEKDGWTLLDGTMQNDYSSMFEVLRYISHDVTYDSYTMEKTMSNRGGFCLRIHPALIQGSDVIKAVFYSSDDNREYTALEVVYDTTDDVQAYIYSSNGDKIYQGINSLGTYLTCMLKYQGAMLDSTDARYDTDFEYYWFKVSSDGERTWNIWIDEEGKLMSQEFFADSLEPIEVKPSSRIIHISAEDVDNINMFQCAVIDKLSMVHTQQRNNLITKSPSEEDLKTASIVNSNLGIINDQAALLNTAYEINAFNISNKPSK